MLIDPTTALAITGAIYFAMAVTVWLLLRSRHARPNIDLWCGAGLLLATTLILLALRPRIGEVLGVYVANACGYAAVAVMAMVLRVEAGRRVNWPLTGAAIAATMALVAMAHHSDLGLGRAAGNAVLALWAGLAAHAAQSVVRRRSSRSARLLVAMFSMMSVVTAARAVVLAFGLVDDPPMTPTALFVWTVAATVLLGVGANLGFMGLSLDLANQAAREQREALDRMREQRQAMDLASRTREAVADERARTTRLLAHEVRQPLHNAAVALQSAIATLARSLDAEEAARAIEQAHSVIRRVSSTLDNTVAATTMLAAQGRISTADTDLQMLCELCLGDLPPEARNRVRIDYRADARSAQLEPSLMRLALRNLLMNATLYAPPDTPVVLRVLDSDEPLAVVIEVEDLGPGIAEELRETLFDEGARGNRSTVPGYGLGLHVVKRVARLHGGSVDWHPNEPHGSIFRITLPQGEGP